MDNGGEGGHNRVMDARIIPGLVLVFGWTIVSNFVQGYREGSARNRQNLLAWRAGAAKPIGGHDARRDQIGHVIDGRGPIIDG